MTSKLKLVAVYLYSRTTPFLNYYLSVAFSSSYACPCPNPFDLVVVIVGAFSCFATIRFNIDESPLFHIIYILVLLLTYSSSAQEVSH